MERLSRNANSCLIYFLNPTPSDHRLVFEIAVLKFFQVATPTSSLERCDVPMAVKWRVDELAERKGWKARRLAEKAGVDIKTARNILTGHATRVDLETIGRLADALGGRAGLVMAARRRYIAQGSLGPARRSRRQGDKRGKRQDCQRGKRGRGRPEIGRKAGRLVLLTVPGRTAAESEIARFGRSFVRDSRRCRT